MKLLVYESGSGRRPFVEWFERLDDAVTAMQQRLAEVEQSGNWDELRALVESS